MTDKKADKKLLAEWFWIDRWMGSSAFLLPMEARGLYREMLTQAWRRGGRLPNDHEAIQRAIGATKKEWDRSWPKVSRFWQQEGDYLTNETQLIVYAECMAEHEGKQARAKAGAGARWGQPSDGRSRQQRIVSARSIGTHTNEEWQALLEFCGRRCLKCGNSQRLTRDHIVAVSAGGSDAIANIQPLCESCNSSKRGGDTDDLRKRLIGFDAFLRGLAVLKQSDGNAQAQPEHASRSPQAAPEQCPPDLDLTPEDIDQNEERSDLAKPHLVRDFLAEHDRLFVARYGQRPAKYTGKDARHAKDLVDQHGFDEACVMLRAFFGSRDQFIAQCGHGLGPLASGTVQNKLIAEMSGLKPMGDGLDGIREFARHG